MIGPYFPQGNDVPLRPVSTKESRRERLKQRSMKFGSKSRKQVRSQERAKAIKEAS